MNERLAATRLYVGPIEIARRLRISVKAIKLYESFGIVRPQRNRLGWRRYGKSDLDRAAKALAYKAMGFGLAQIAALLDADAREIAAALATQERRVLQRRAEIDELLAQLRKAQGHSSLRLRRVA